MNIAENSNPTFILAWHPDYVQRNYIPDLIFPYLIFTIRELNTYSESYCHVWFFNVKFIIGLQKTVDKY